MQSYECNLIAMLRSGSMEVRMKKIVILLMSIFAGVVVGACTVGKAAGKVIDKEKGMSEKHLTLFMLMNQWIKVRQRENACRIFSKAWI